MLFDVAKLEEFGAVGAKVPSEERGKWKCKWKIDKFLDGKVTDTPDEVEEGEGNLLVTAGITAMLNLLIGAGGTTFNNTNAYIGVGDSSTAASAGQTDLQGTLAGTKTITAATNATPISVTSTAHGYTTGDTITVAAVGGNTAANGTWSIIVVDANTFTLNGSVGNGAYTSGGTAAKGNRMRVIMDATYPQVSGAVVTFKATFSSLNGNFAWQEFGIFNGILTTATMLNRAVASNGTKASGSSWVFTVTVTIS